MAFVGLYKKRFLLAGDLSFGQQKLLEFAMSLMKKPKMLLLDEPTAGVNPTLINGLIDPDVLENIGSSTIRKPVTLKYNGALKIFDEPIENTMYIMGVDTAKGTGGDYSCVQVLKIKDES